MSNTTTQTVVDPFDPTKPHCMEDARYVSPEGTDGGGHVTCLTELNADGSCPKADVHHKAMHVWLRANPGKGFDDWAATVVAARSTAPAVDTSDVLILESSNVTANVQTRTGSRYTVVTRPAVGTVLIHDGKGWAIKGAKLVVREGRMYLLNDEGQILACTTSITGIYIMSN